MLNLYSNGLLFIEGAPPFGTDAICVANDPIPAPPSLVMPRRKGWKALVVDGNSDIRLRARRLLADFRFNGRPLEIIDACTAAEARDVLAQHADIAVALVGVVMRTGDAGLRLVRHIRKDLGNQHCRILLCAGQPADGSVRETLATLDVNDYLETSQLTEQRLGTAFLCALRCFEQLEIKEGLCRTLEAQLEQRTAELRAAKDEAERANRIQSAFLARTSYELRTQLTAILGFSELIRDIGRSRSLPAPVTVYADHVLKAGDHLMGLVNHYLDPAKIEAGAMELDPMWFDTEDALRAAMSVMKERAAKAEVSMTCTVGPGAAFLWADQNGFTRIITNLVFNAIKFTPRHGHIKVSARGASDGIAIMVDDDGCGIPADILQTVFSPFEHMDNRTNRGLPGTGLGLSLVKAMMEIHKGLIQIDSTAGVGTTVTLWFPLPVAEQTDVESHILSLYARTTKND